MCEELRSTLAWIAAADARLTCSVPSSRAAPAGDLVWGTGESAVFDPLHPAMRAPRKSPANDVASPRRADKDKKFTCFLGSYGCSSSSSVRSLSLLCFVFRRFIIGRPKSHQRQNTYMQRTLRARVTGVIALYTPQTKRTRHLCRTRFYGVYSASVGSVEFSSAARRGEPKWTLVHEALRNDAAGEKATDPIGYRSSGLMPLILSYCVFFGGACTET